jgi:hypothetical protein
VKFALRELANSGNLVCFALLLLTCGELSSRTVYLFPHLIGTMRPDAPYELPAVIREFRAPAPDNAAVIVPYLELECSHIIIRGRIGRPGSKEVAIRDMHTANNPSFAFPLRVRSTSSD